MVSWRFPLVIGGLYTSGSRMDRTILGNATDSRCVGNRFPDSARCCPALEHIAGRGTETAPAAVRVGINRPGCRRLPAVVVGQGNRRTHSRQPGAREHLPVDEVASGQPRSDSEHVSFPHRTRVGTGYRHLARSSVDVLQGDGDRFAHSSLTTCKKLWNHTDTGAARRD